MHCIAIIGTYAHLYVCCATAWTTRLYLAPLVICVYGAMAAVFVALILSYAYWYKNTIIHLTL